MSEYKLCYIRKPWAWFTTKSLEDQWGDDWNDAPYEHNAGTPYTPCWHNKPGSSKYPCDCDICKQGWNEDGTPKWRVDRIAFSSGVLMVPGEFDRNSGFSVEVINSGAIPWLRSPSSSNKSKVSIWAGDSPAEFYTKLKEVNEEIWVQPGSQLEMHFKHEGFIE